MLNHLLNFSQKVFKLKSGLHGRTLVHTSMDKGQKLELRPSISWTDSDDRPLKISFNLNEGWQTDKISSAETWLKLAQRRIPSETLTIWKLALLEKIYKGEIETFWFLTILVWNQLLKCTLVVDKKLMYLGLIWWGKRFLEINSTALLNAFSW